MKLYTGQGDDGSTLLFDGSRVSKHHERVEAYGTVDELNAHVGMARYYASLRSSDGAIAILNDRLEEIQRELFRIGADLATPPHSTRSVKSPPVSAELSAKLEEWIDEAAAMTPPIRTFVLPCGGSLAAQLHICRTVSRRAERRVVALGAAARVSPHLLIYLNRLSDLFFAWARLANHAAGIEELPWSGTQT